MNNIKLIHYYNYEEDPLITYLLTLTVEITPEKVISTYEYVTPDTYPNSKKKVIEKESDVYNKINEIDITNLKDNYKRNDLAEYWELYIGDKKIVGSYFNIPKEVTKIMTYVDLINQLRYDLGE
ncbi:MAG: hypothetical protein IJI43_04530 [Bacilli bacterium]|nr:hypothetical protein [Bacilli bacterium]